VGLFLWHTVNMGRGVFRFDWDYKRVLEVSGSKAKIGVMRMVSRRAPGNFIQPKRVYGRPVLFKGVQGLNQRLGAFLSPGCQFQGHWGTREGLFRRFFHALRKQEVGRSVRKQGDGQCRSRQKVGGCLPNLVRRLLAAKSSPKNLGDWGWTWGSL
jgi:hypothetical protein